jgi:hypothetical protein
MWMAYSPSIEIKDLKSGVEHLNNEFQKLGFDAEHEAIYGLGRFYTPEECEKIAEKYNKGSDVCEQYLQREIPLEKLISELIDCDLKNFLYRILDYLPENLKSVINNE